MSLNSSGLPSSPESAIGTRLPLALKGLGLTCFFEEILGGAPGVSESSDISGRLDAEFVLLTVSRNRLDDVSLAQESESPGEGGSVCEDGR